MRQTGIISETKGDYAIVSIRRSTACGENCKSCGLCSEKNSEVEAKNTINAKKGDIVVLELGDQKIITAAFLVYILPIISFFIGYGVFNYYINSIPFSALFGILFSVVTFYFIKKYDKYIIKKGNYTPIIIKVVKHR